MLPQLACVVLISTFAYSYESSSEFVLPIIDNYSAFTIPANPTINQIGFAIIDTATQLTAELINEKQCNFGDILPNTKIILETLITRNINAVSTRHSFIKTVSNLSQNVVKHIMSLSEQNKTFAAGFAATEAVRSGAISGSVYNVAQLSSFAPDSSLSNKKLYPYLTRTAVSTVDQVKALIDILLYYQEVSGPGWTDVAIVAEVLEYAVDFSNVFLHLSSQDFTILSYRTFLIDETNFDSDLQEIKDSGARVILCLVSNTFPALLERANDFGLVGESYVWYVPPIAVSLSFYQPIPLARGVLGSVFSVPENPPDKECFVNHWMNADPVKYPFTQRIKIPPLTTYLPFDMMVIAALAIDTLDKQELLDGQYISPQLWADTLRNITFNGLSGFIEFNSIGDRIDAEITIQYYNPDINAFVDAATHSDSVGLSFQRDVVWFSNTTEIPDLDIRDPFYYWSCEEQEEGYDPTGKSVVVHSPNGSDVDEIDIDYHCDHFIDCENLSDESSNCSSNYRILFIVFGVITGILILLALLLILFVVVFGVILNYQRLRTASPFFLILLLISIIIGYSSVFSFFGKPHSVACGFQPWLLGLPAVSMIAALSVKNFRIWRIFRYPLKKTRISDFELLILWGVVMIPALIIVILWTIISTPNAAMEERDGKEHYVCVTGGFTGPPGGLVFFFILVGYSSMVLCVGGIVSILTRNVPSLFNESKLLTISIYNLGFLSIVIIPLFLSLQPFNPFVAWILRTCAVLYAFTATMFLQFIPKVFGIFVVDKCKNVQQKGTLITTTQSSFGNSY